MKKIYSVVVMSAGLLFSSWLMAAPEITVYKSPTCGCCVKWVSHLEKNGFKVNAINVKDVIPHKIKHGVTPQLASCHTAVIDGYTIEGHVPAVDIKRLLKERPKNVVGLSVPKMPVGPPGMEYTMNHTARKDPYKVLSFDKQGKSSVFTDYKNY